MQIHRIGDVTVLNTYTEIPDSGSFPSTPTSVMPTKINERRHIERPVLLA